MRPPPTVTAPGLSGVLHVSTRDPPIMSLSLRVALTALVVGADWVVLRAAPGDRLLRDGSIVPGPARAAPPCRHFPQCGGCQLQHLSEAAYADYVRDRVVGGLAAQGIEAVDVRPAIVSPPHTRRRVALRALKAQGGVQIGFNEGGSHRVVDLAECWVMDPALFALIAPLRQLFGRFLPAKRAAEIKLTLTDQGADLLIEGFAPDGLAAAEALTAFAEQHRLARLSVDDGYGPETRWEPEPVTVTLGGVPVAFPPYNFLQATPEGEAALVAAAGDAVGDAPIIADLFCGLGTFALALADGRKVYAAEAAREPLLALKAAAARAGKAVMAEHRDLFRRPLMAADASRFAAVLLDPPRAGAEAQVEQLASSSCPVIAYVSCNPASFARDARALIAGGYRLDWVQPVGQFRWSTHVELAARFSR